MRAVLLFARSPEAEARVKGLPVRRAVPLFEALVAGWSIAAKRAGATLMVACDGASEAPLIRASGASSVLRQRGATFGERLANSAADAFAAGATAVLIVGIDSPAPPSVLIDQAFTSVQNGAAVIGPARDGGLYLIGLNRQERALLETIKVGDHDLVDRFRAHFGSTLVVLPSTTDLDSSADLRKAAFDNDEFWSAYQCLLHASPPPPRSPAITYSSIDLAGEPSRAPPRFA